MSDTRSKIVEIQLNIQRMREQKRSAPKIVNTGNVKDASMIDKNIDRFNNDQSTIMKKIMQGMNNG